MKSPFGIAPTIPLVPPVEMNQTGGEMVLPFDASATTFVPQSGRGADLASLAGKRENPQNRADLPNLTDLLIYHGLGDKNHRHAAQVHGDCAFGSRPIDSGPSARIANRASE